MRPPVAIARPCPACRGTVQARRCPTAHRWMLVCGDCGWRAPLPEALRLRLAGWRELPLFEEEEFVIGER